MDAREYISQQIKLKNIDDSSDRRLYQTNPRPEIPLSYKQKAGLVLTAQHHAREVVSNSVVLFYVLKLIFEGLVKGNQYHLKHLM